MIVRFLKKTGSGGGIGAEGLADAERLADSEWLGLADEIVEGEGDTDMS